MLIKLKETKRYDIWIEHKSIMVVREWGWRTRIKLSDGSKFLVYESSDEVVRKVAEAK
jgi:uncharacterized protein YlzI (FlbEa/FlbD family)